MSGTTDSPEPTWTHLTALLDRGGHVTLGRVDPFDGVAVAADARRVLASLLRREGESAVALMARLEATLQRAAAGDVPAQEINEAHFGLRRPTARRRKS